MIPYLWTICVYALGIFAGRILFGQKREVRRERPHIFAARIALAQGIGLLDDGVISRVVMTKAERQAMLDLIIETEGDE